MRGRFFLFLLAFAAVVCAAQPPASGPALKVNFDKSLQDDFLGVNGIYHGFAFMPEETARGMNDADRAREFDRVRRMRLRIARTWYRPDWACGNSISQPFNWGSPKMEAFYRWLSAMQKAGVDVAIQAAWWFPNDTHYGLEKPDPARDLPRYTEWVSESLHQIIEVRGFKNVRYLILFTEPTQSDRKTMPPGETVWSYYVKTVNATHERLVADGRRKLVKLVGPNNGLDARNLKNAVDDLNRVIDIYSGHTYKVPGYEGWLSLTQSMSSIVAPTGKPIWFDEYGAAGGSSKEDYRASGDYGTCLAEIVAATMNAGHQTSLIWLLFDQLYVSPLDRTESRDSFHLGVHRWGTAKWPHDNIAGPTLPYPSWYALSLLSRYLGGGGRTRILGTEGVPGFVVAATASAKGDQAFLVVNSGTDARDFQLAFSSPVKRTLYRYVYAPEQVKPAEDARMIGYDRTFGNPGGSLSDRLSGRSFAIYTTVRGERAEHAGE